MSSAGRDDQHSSPDGRFSAAMTAISVLDLYAGAAADGPPPAHFADLALDQIVAAVTAGKQDYDLAPFFHRPLQTRAEVEYRQAAMRDLEIREVHDAVAQFAAAMRQVRGDLAVAEKLHYPYQKEAWRLDAIADYAHAVDALRARLRQASPSSAALRAFLAFLDGYVGSVRFAAMRDGAAALKAKLAEIRYTLLIGDGAVAVGAFRDEPDYGAEIEADFAKFRQAAGGDYRFKFLDAPSMNHIEAGVLERVARLNPEVFASLDAFTAENAEFVDAVVRRFDREVQFYLSYLAHMRRIAPAGLAFCYPEVSTNDKEIAVRDAYDLALAARLRDKGAPVVVNDMALRGAERIVVVSGPNQGGKTTFARMFGQLHYLASLGLPTPGREAKLFLFDRLITHFEREETVQNLRGKLFDDLTRLHEALSAATSRSVFVLNEPFNSTSLADAILLNTKILRRIVALDALCVCVSFIDELAALSATTVAMASTVKPDNPAERTFKIVRRPPDGLAYALSIAEKHRLTYAQLRARLSP